MNEMIKTASFLAVAVIVVLVAVLTGPSWHRPVTEDVRGSLLDPQFTDPGQATSLVIVVFDKDVGQARPFSVARIGNQWSIPSHQDYPADAEGQLGKAAASLLGLKILSVASGAESGTTTDANVQQIYSQYGVVDPETAKPSDEGVGTKVTMKDKNGTELLSLVIGKEVPDQSELRYVRHVGKGQPVYVVKVDTSKLSTKFEDWIESDLLKLSTWDLKQVDIQDYTVGVLGNQFFSDLKGRMTLQYDDAANPKWKLTEDMVFEKGKGLVPVKMAADEELDTDKLREMADALDDLKIVDVQRKPPGLSADLRIGGTLSSDLETTLSLQQRGFYFVPVTVDNEEYLQLLSTKGETRVLMKDGVEYVLRFGEVAGAGTEEAEKKPAEDEAKSGEEKGKEGEKKAGEENKEEGGRGMNRYIFVMAEFNPDAIAKPELEELPKEAAEPAPPAQADAAENTGKDEAKGAAQNTSTDAAKDASKDTAKGTAKDKADQPAEKAAGEDAKQEKADVKADAKAEPGQTPDAQTETKPEAKTDAKTGSEADKQAHIKAERERIEKENKRKQEEYQKKIDEGKNKVRELNARFADWYYIISDDVYKKIHLSRDQIIKKKEKKEEEGKEKVQPQGAGTDAGQEKPEEPAGPLQQFDNLKKEGPAKAE
jgi:hypothetical protein